jgi:hypothetical protein
MRKEEKMEIGYKAVQVATGVPIWNLFEVVVSEGKVEEKEVGSLTDFPNEGPMATVRLMAQIVLFQAQLLMSVWQQLWKPSLI